MQIRTRKNEKGKNIKKKTKKPKTHQQQLNGQTRGTFLHKKIFNYNVELIHMHEL